MATFDLSILLLLGVSLIYSFFRGMIREIFSILGYTSGYLMAIKFHEPAAAYLHGFIHNKLLGQIVGFCLIFILASIVVKLLGQWVQKLMKLAGGLSGFDKIMGGILGLAKGLFILSIFIIPLEFFPDIDKKITVGSVFSPYLKSLSSVLRQNMFNDKKLGNISGDPAPNYFKKIPSSSGYLNKKNKLGLMGKLKNLPRDIKSAIVKIIPQNGSPQDEYSEKSKKELEELLRSKLNK